NYLIIKVSHPTFKSLVIIHYGDILDNFELEIINIKTAKSIFFLSSSKIYNIKEIDEYIILNVLAIKNFNNEIDIYAQVIEQNTKDYLIQIGIKVVLSIN